jgi:hypothetical protein
MNINKKAVAVLLLSVTFNIAAAQKKVIVPSTKPAPAVQTPLTPQQPAATNSLQKFVGTYKMEIPIEITITLKDAVLYAKSLQVPEPMELILKSGNRYKMKEGGPDIEFILDATGKVTGLNMIQNGRKTKGTKIK